MLLGMVNFRECFSPSCLLQMILKEPQRSINSDKQSPRMMTNFQNTKILEMQVFSVRPVGEDYPITAFFENKRFIFKFFGKL